MFTYSPRPSKSDKVTATSSHSSSNMDQATTSVLGAHSPAAQNMTLMTKIFALEKSLLDELNKLKEEVRTANGGNLVNGAEGNSYDISSPGVNGAHEYNNGQHGSNPKKQSWSFDSIGKDIAVSSSNQWMPLGVRDLPPLNNTPLETQPLPLENLQSFTLEYLINVLGGEEWSPGVYYPASEAKLHSKQLKNMVKSKTYYCMDADVEPFLPKEPGAHGAKLTVFFRENDTDEEHMHENVPLFVSLPGKVSPAGAKLYTYFGHYSQARWSDKLDHDTVEERVPKHVKDHWAEKLVGHNRPGWLQQAVVEHFWPRPAYDGVIPEGINDEEEVEKEEVKECMRSYLLDLADWKREAGMKSRMLKKEHILNAFSKADAAEEPGLRFWWEYLQCIGFDRNFYYLLVNAPNPAHATEAQPAAPSNGAI